jgi:site-specific DNA recombinase
VAVANNSRDAVLYARVSSKEQELGYSMPAQQELLRSHAAQLEVRIAEEFGDAETAKTTGRPGFAAMVCYLKQHPACRILLVEKTDRLYRNFKDYLTIDELGVEIHLVKENVILTADSKSSEKFMHGIKVLMAKELHRQSRRGGAQETPHQGSSRPVPIVCAARISQHRSCSRGLPRESTP